MTCISLASIASQALAEDPPFPPIDIELPQLPQAEPFIPPDDSQPVPPGAFFTLFPDEELPVSEYVTLDHDGDTISDLIVPLIAFDPDAPAFGRVKLFSGWTGQTLHELVSPEANDLFGFTVIGVPDIDGDGAAELLIGAPASGDAAELAGKAYLHSGADGALLATFTGLTANGAFGFAVAAAGDVDGDGIEDLAIAAPFDGPGRVFIFSGVDADAANPPDLTPADAIIAHWGEENGDLFGFSLANAGNLDGDGLADLIVGVPSWDDPDEDDTDNRGRVYLFAGSDGSLVGTVSGLIPEQLFGYSVASVGDFNSDGSDDVIVGAPSTPMIPGGKAFIFTDFCEPGTEPDRTCANAYLSFTPSVPGDGLFGILVARSDDMNDDGERDLLVHAGFDSTGDGALDATRGYVYSGLDGGLLYTFTADDAPTPPGPGDDDGEVDQVRIVLDNFGMENPTYDDGDLNADGAVDVTDLLIAIDNLTNGEQANGDAACLQPPYWDEDGNLVDPCENPDDTTAGGCCSSSLPNLGDGFWEPCNDFMLPDPCAPILLESDCVSLATCAAANDIAAQWNNLSQQKMNAIDARDQAVNDALEQWQGTTEPNMWTENSPRGHAEQVRRAMIAVAVDEAKGDVILGGAGIFLGTIGAAGSAAPVVVALLLGTPVGWSAVLGGAVISTAGFVVTTVAFAGSADDLQAAVDVANESYMTNPARQQFLTTVQDAEMTLQMQCDALEAQEDALLEEMQNNYENLLQDCLEGSFPCP